MIGGLGDINGVDVFVVGFAGIYGAGGLRSVPTFDRAVLGAGYEERWRVTEWIFEC